MNKDRESNPDISDLWKDSISRIQQESGFSSKIPEIKFKELQEIHFEIDSGELVDVGRSSGYDSKSFVVYFPEWVEDNKDDHIADTDFDKKCRRIISDIAVHELSDEIDESTKRIFDNYGISEHNYDILVEFSDFDRDTRGRYDDGQRPPGILDDWFETVTLDFGLISCIDLETGEMRGYSKNKLKEVLDHEISHSLKYRVDPQSNVLSRYVSKNTEGQEEYTKDVNRASLEAVTCFEEHLDDEDVNWYGLGAVDAGIPERQALIQVLPKLMSSSRREDGLSYDNPYDLGKAAAFTTDLALRNEKGEDSGRALTREFLKTITTTPVGLEGVIENSLKKLGLENIHEEVYSISDKLSNSDKPNQIAITELAKNREMYEDRDLILFRDMAVSKAMEWETGDASIYTPDLDNPYRTW